VTSLIKVLVVFAGILLLSRLRVPLGVALVAGGIGLDVWSGKPTSAVWEDGLAALTRPELWLLLVVTALILELGRYIAAERNANTIMLFAKRLGGRHGRALSLMIIPSLIGLVPMPGGALFSAPLVAQTVKEDRWSAEWKSAVNYWFRHVWEYWWPLYPVVILSLSIFAMETWQFELTLIGFTPLSILAGYLFLVRPHLHQLAWTPSGGRIPTRRMLVLSLPLCMVVVCTLLLPLFLGRWFPGMALSTRKLAAMLIGLIGAAAVMVWDQRNESKKVPLFKELLTNKTANVLVTLGGVLVFESFLNASGLLPDAGTALARHGLSSLFVIAVLPFVAGLVTGIAVGFAGAAFPLVAGLLETPGTGLTPMATLVLAFGFGYAGMMLSPVHLCFVLTRGYFAASYASIYRHIAPCVAALILAALALHALYRVGGW